MNAVCRAVAEQHCPPEQRTANQHCRRISLPSFIDLFQMCLPQLCRLQRDQPC